MAEPFMNIVRDPRILGGKPCATGTRISVEVLLELIADGAGIEEIVDGWPPLTAEQVQEAIRSTRKGWKSDGCPINSQRRTGFESLAPGSAD